MWRTGHRWAEKNREVRVSVIELRVVSGAAKGQTLESQADRISVGRATDQTIVLNDPFVSRHHGEIVLLPSGYQYRDLQSTQGTNLKRDGQIRQVSQIFLHPGDELGFGGRTNVLRIGRIDPAIFEDADSTISRLHVQAKQTIAPEERYADDWPALKALVKFDSVVMHAEMTSDGPLCRALLEHLSGLFGGLAYAAVLEWEGDRPRLVDSELIDKNARARLSSTILSTVQNAGRGIVFQVDAGAAMSSQGRIEELSEQSMLKSPSGSFYIFSGICVPLGKSQGARKYVQLERPKGRGEFTPRDLELVASMALRVTDKLQNFRLIRENHRLHHTASLGIFAGMIGHDIKNYLFYGKKLSEITDDKLGEHPGITKGIERARKLAESMKDMVAPGRADVSSFSLREVTVSISEEFRSLFGKGCAFETSVDENLGEITSNQDLLSRVLWNLVMNAYHSMENRPSSITEAPCVRIRVAKEGSQVRLEVEDNAGGIGPRTLEYIRRSFEVIADAYNDKADLVDVVNEIGEMRGFTNSIGLFFTTAAVNDLGGTLQVESTPAQGSIFTIRIPETISATKNLLVY